jgi:phosphopantothenoylcysteine decarboxylase / phosphopantothenate---cysteine ligase
MGLTLAKELANQGARVTVVLGPVEKEIPPALSIIHVTTARDMSRAVRRHLKHSDAFIATAAVCDWRPRFVARQKMKKSSLRLRLDLVRNPDILEDAGRWKGKKRQLILVGFALETNQLDRRAIAKLKGKNLDLIIGNSPESFGSSSIRPLWIEKSGTKRRLGRITKKALSSRIARWLNGQLSTEKK